MTTIATGGTLTIDGRVYRAENVDVIGPEYQTFDCQVPDGQWTATDRLGHEHRYWRRGSDAKAALELPTLERHERHVECDGNNALHPFEEFCEGYTEVYWTCIVCGDEVQPGSRRGTESVKSREAYYEVTTSIDLAELAAADGYVVIDSTPASHDAARLVWPTGPGQTLDVTGRAWETRTAETAWRSTREPARVTQVWAVSDAG